MNDKNVRTLPSFLHGLTSKLIHRVGDKLLLRSCFQEVSGALKHGGGEELRS
ncbi:MAG: hypothetical protein WDO74_04780 [Pseudomonadota bacterium]